MHRKALAFAAGAALVATASAMVAGQAGSFSLKDPKGVNAVTFLCDSPIEPIVGSADGIDGTVTFDPANLKASRGTITIASESVKATNSGMTEHLMGAEWLAPKTSSVISFEVTSIEDAKKLDDETFELKAKGTFTMKGVSEEKSIDLVVKYLPGRLGERNRGAEGDLLSFRTSFKFDRLKFKLGPDFPGLGSEVEVTVALAAARQNGTTTYSSK